MSYRKLPDADEARYIRDQYFDDLTAEIPAMIGVTAIVDEYGHPVMETIYINPPTVAGLALRLGMSKAEFLRICTDADHPLHDVCAEAKQRIEEYLEGKLITNRQADGVKFNLINNFRESWREKQEIELGEETRKSEALAAISLREKLELIITASEKARATMEKAKARETEADDAGSSDDTD